MNLDKITQRYLTKFPTETSYHTFPRTIAGKVSALVKPEHFPNHQLLFFNEKLAEELGLGKLNDNGKDFLAAQNLPQNFHPYATAYAGHQFGQWAGQLGDGRAILAGEIATKKSIIYELQWKGAGATPFSRRGDGRAVLRSSIREFLMSEAMHHLGVPTTRALSLSLTGEMVVRDILYNGNPQPEPGAIIMRTAESFLRFGHFEWFSAQRDMDTLKKVLDFTIENYFPEISLETDQSYREYFKIICRKTANLMVEWQRVGFVHGVMNTDNMSAIGLTIDYGPFAIMEEYNPLFTSNTTDIPGRRYAFGEQPSIAQWNLWKLANALFPLIEDAEFLSEELEKFNQYYHEEFEKMIAHKLGFSNVTPEVIKLIDLWIETMENIQPDYNLFFTALETWNEEKNSTEHFEICLYQKINIQQEQLLNNFVKTHLNLLQKLNISKEEQISTMQKNNPKFVLRNYLLYECINEVTHGKMDLFYRLYEALQNPYYCNDPYLIQKRPSQYNDQPGCGMLSCSS